MTGNPNFRYFDHCSFSIIFLAPASLFRVLDRSGEAQHSNQTFQMTSICSLTVLTKLFKANTTTRRPIISWWLPVYLVSSNSRSHSQVSSPFIDNPFKVATAPVNEREPGEVDDLVNKTPRNKETPLAPATESTTVTRADYSLGLTQHI